VRLLRIEGGQISSGCVGETKKLEGPGMLHGTGRGVGFGKTHSGGGDAYSHATACVRQRPQAHRADTGVPSFASEAAPIRRKECQEKSAHLEPARRRWRFCWRVDLDMLRGRSSSKRRAPPMLCSVLTQAAGHGAHGAVIQRLATFSSKKTRVPGC
jgi:hypothetical protein